MTDIEPGRLNWEDDDVIVFDEKPKGKAFDPSEPRDEHGRWTDGGGSDDSPSEPSTPGDDKQLLISHNPSADRLNIGRRRSTCGRKS